MDKPSDKQLFEMKAYTDDTLMPFGKYKGRRLKEVPGGYYAWLLDQGNIIDKQLEQYIDDNWDDWISDDAAYQAEMGHDERD